MKIMIFGICLLIILSMLDTVAHRNEKPTVSATTISISKPDYELDLEERCKDWVFFRNKTYKLAIEGNEEGAATARKMMNRFYNDLRKNFSDEQISAEIAKWE